MSRPFEFTGRIRSFGHAINGIWLMVRSQQNAWIHAAATAAVVALGLMLRVSANEWMWLVIAIVTVWTAEALNTAFEFLADATVAEFHPLVKNAKDVAAGAVLVSALGAVVIGCIVFLPKLLALLG